jgi:hypothetical protein
MMAQDQTMADERRAESHAGKQEKSGKQRKKEEEKNSRQTEWTDLGSKPRMQSVHMLDYQYGEVLPPPSLSMSAFRTSSCGVPGEFVVLRPCNALVR